MSKWEKPHAKTQRREEAFWQGCLARLFDQRSTTNNQRPRTGAGDSISNIQCPISNDQVGRGRRDEGGKLNAEGGEGGVNIQYPISNIQFPSGWGGTTEGRRGLQRGAGRAGGEWAEGTRGGVNIQCPMSNFQVGHRWKPPLLKLPPLPRLRRSSWRASSRAAHLRLGLGGTSGERGGRVAIHASPLTTPPPNPPVPGAIGGQE